MINAYANMLRQMKLRPSIQRSLYQSFESLTSSQFLFWKTRKAAYRKIAKQHPQAYQGFKTLLRALKPAPQKAASNPSFFRRIRELLH